MQLTKRLPSRKRAVIFTLLLGAVLASGAYLHFGGGFVVPSPVAEALSSVQEDWGGWIKELRSSPHGRSEAYGGPPLRAAEDPGLEEGDPGSGSLVTGSAASSSTEALEVLDFDSSVSSTLFRAWGSVAVRTGSTIPYLILNATLWDGDQLVEGSRYMMMDLEPGTGRDFDIRKSSRLRPEVGYSCLLEVVEPEGLLSMEGVAIAELRDCLVVEEDPQRVIWGGSEEPIREAPSERPSVEPLSRYGSATGIQSFSFRSTEGSRGFAASSEELEGDERSQDSVTAIDEEEETVTGPADDLGYEYVGSKTSDKYHRPDCKSAKKIKPENRITFSDVWEAREAGYSPCKVCNPG
jgi:hypothetical protein